MARADRLLESSPNLLGAVAAAAALQLLEIGGTHEIEAAVLKRSGAVLELVRSIGGEVIEPWRNDRERAGIVTFRIPGVGSAEMVAALGIAGFIVSERSGWVRVSPHATTPLGAIEAFGDALRDQARNA